MVSDALLLERIHELAANYSDRQGLRIVPIGIALMLGAFPRAPWQQPLLPFDPFWLALAAGIGGYYFVGLYYKHRFGRVEEMPPEGLPIALQIPIVVFCFVVAVFIDVALKPPVFVSGLVIAAWLTGVAWPSRHIRKQYLSMSTFLGFLSIGAPLIGQSQRDVASMYAFLFGVLLLLAGVRDHIKFVKVFPPMESE